MGARAMPRVALTDRFAAGVKQPSGQADYFDSKLTGLVLRVSESGVKSWCLFYTSPKDGKRARAALGTLSPNIPGRRACSRA